MFEKVFYREVSSGIWEPATGRRQTGDQLRVVEYDLHPDGSRCYWGDTCPDVEDHQ